MTHGPHHVAQSRTTTLSRSASELRRQAFNFTAGAGLPFNAIAGSSPPSDCLAMSFAPAGGAQANCVGCVASGGLHVIDGHQRLLHIPVPLAIASAEKSESPGGSVRLRIDQQRRRRTGLGLLQLDRRVGLVINLHIVLLADTEYALVSSADGSLESATRVRDSVHR